MKRTLVKILVLLVAFVGVMAIEMLLLKEETPMEVVQVYITESPVKSGDSVEMSNLRSVEIPKHLASTYILKDKKSGYFQTDLKTGEFIYAHQISDMKPMTIPKGHRLITIQCDVVESNGWLFKINERVDVVMNISEEQLVIKDAIVTKIFDENLKDETLPAYVSLMVPASDAMKYYFYLSNAEVFISKKH